MATFTKLPSGKIRAQIRIAGFYRAQTFDLEKTARKWAREVEQQLKLSASSDHVDPHKDSNLGDLICKYEEIEGAEKPFGKNKAAVLKALKKKLGHVKLRVLSPIVVRDFVDRRRKEGAGGVTISIDLAYLKTILNWGRYVRKLNVRPDIVSDVRAGLKHTNLKMRSTERKRIASAHEIEKIFEHYKKMKRSTIDMISVIEFALLTSLRQEEVCSVQIEDIDMNARVMIVRDRKHPTEKEGNDSAVPILDDFVDVINKAMGGRKSGSLFPYNPRSVSASFTRACKALKIKDLHFHDLRHTATTDLFARELEIQSVSLFTGHKDWKTLRRYTHIRPESVHLDERRKALRRAQEDESQRSADVTPI
ncbi:tyrosine-type recombinase/integrase [Stutzerimonas nitrititolerans]|uniref:tyrosine-type recombinase/integrase n=1 Tax=Stutzerimonas nitrititolerans TaxID=2482751 RepID=UPI00289CBD5A|nr:site-specific integrase [Stutzerimonas nitrititolerans]